MPALPAEPKLKLSTGKPVLDSHASPPLSVPLDFSVQQRPLWARSVLCFVGTCNRQHPRKSIERTNL